MKVGLSKIHLVAVLVTISSCEKTHSLEKGMFIFVTVHHGRESWG